MENKLKPQPGDLIWADRGLYHHCGIYEGGGYVIHFAAKEGSEVNAENAVVHRTSFDHFKDGCPVKVINIEGAKSPEETLRRARTCYGMKDYNFTTFNCDHFATWCKTGEYRSIQVDQAKTVFKLIGGPIAEVVCTVHDIAEAQKAQHLDTVYPKDENEILETIQTNAYVTETIPPVPDEENDIQPGYEIVVEEEPNVEIESNEVIDDGQDDADLSPKKKAWYEKVGGVLKDLTYPISGALEFLKRTNKLPILKNVDFLHLGAKVRNVIDNVVNTIKVFTGRMTKEQAIEERMNNETALAGQIIQQKQKQPIGQTLRNVFGKVGSVVKHVVQQVVTRVVPAPVRKVIKTVAKTIGTKIASGVRTVWQKAKQGVKSFFAKVKQKLFGKGRTA